MPSRSRRRLLTSAGSLSVVGLAGCASLLHSDPHEDQSRDYDELRGTPIYVADDVGLRLPDTADRVDGPENAELLALHGNLAATPAQVVTWLTADRVLALLGDRAEASWLEVVGSDAYREAFQSEGYGDSEPDPHLLVGAAIGDYTTTYRKTWGDQPTNDEIMTELDETLADIEDRRSEQGG